MQENRASFTCIVCPLGCSLVVFEDPGGEDNLLVEGNRCRRGEEYAVEEYRNPCRSLTTTVATVFKDCPRLPVRTRGEILLKDIFRAMQQINSLKVEQHMKPGEVVIQDLVGTGVPVIATGSTRPVLEGCSNVRAGFKY